MRYHHMRKPVPAAAVLAPPDSWSERLEDGSQEREPGPCSPRVPGAMAGSWLPPESPRKYTGNRRK
jgi:hypothetical protein